jgi:hypothetical protein
LYGFGSGDTVQSGVLLSRDAGSTWSTVPDVTFDYPSGAAGLGVILQPLALSKNGSVILVGSVLSQLWLSTDRGASFVDITDRIVAADTAPEAPTPAPAAVSAAAVKSKAPKPSTVKVG